MIATAKGRVRHHPSRSDVADFVSQRIGAHRSAIGLNQLAGPGDRLAQYLLTCKNLLADSQAVPVYNWCWVTFGAQNMLISRKRQVRLPAMISAAEVVVRT